MYRHRPALALANPFSGRHPHASGLPWWGGALLAFTVAVPPLAAQQMPTDSGQAEVRINFPNSLAPLPHDARIVTVTRPIAEAEPVAFQVAFRMDHGALPASDQYLAVAEWFKAQGFVVTGVDLKRYLPINATGTVAQARAALKVQFDRVEVDEKQFIVAVTTPSLPAPVGRAVLGINGLQPFLHANKGPVAVPITKKSVGD